jgi:cytoskeletal protein CcmA (bactofilin family)
MGGLFGGRKDEEDVSLLPTGSERVDTIIGKGTQVNGKIIAEGLVRIDGRFEGDIQSAGDVIVGESGTVLADVNLRHLTVAGELHGDARLAGRLEITATGKLIGDISVDTLLIRDGGIFKGQCEMRSPQPEVVQPIEL